MPRKGNHSRTWRLAANGSEVGIRASKLEPGKLNENKGKILCAVNKFPISRWATESFKFTLRLCAKYSLVPFKQQRNGTFVVASQKQIWKCYIMCALGALTCTYKFLATFRLATHSHFDVRLAVCIWSVSVSLVTWLPSCAFLSVLEDGVAMLNSFPSALLYLNDK